MEESVLLNNIYQKEKELQLEKELIKGIPLWRLVRFYTRVHYINLQTGYVASSASQKEVGPKRLKLFSGFWKFLFKKDLNIFFSFKRLVKNDDQFLDKFIDPIIEESFLKDANYLIVDPRHYSGNYSRMHKEYTISNERRTLSMQVLKHLFKLITPFVQKKKVLRVFNQAKVFFELPDSFIGKYYDSVAMFYTEYYYFLCWLKLLRPRRVLLVYRGNYLGVIAACKRLSIPVAELQHGITLDKTVSYTGEYDNRIDPDYFFTFGKYWKSNNFGMTDEKIFCIGWAYSQMIKRRLKKSEKQNETVLVISSPEISEALLDAITHLAKWNPRIKYHIRLHPSESYNEELKIKLSKISQAEVVDNSFDSAIVLPLYNYVVGENSSVLYEALSMGCKVGLLNICGLCPPIDKPGIVNSFQIIETPDDFQRFLDEKNINDAEKESFYSDFDGNKFREFLNQYM